MLRDAARLTVSRHNRSHVPRPAEMPPRRTTPTVLRRYIAVLVIGLLGGVLSVAAFLYERQQDHSHLRQRFEFLAKERAARMQADIERALESLTSTGGFFDASSEVTRAEFEAFLRTHLDSHPELRAIEWLPRITADQRASFEAAARADGLGDFRITERAADESLVRAAERPEYFPVWFTMPLERNRPALGFDAYSRPNNRSVMDASRDSGTILATEAFTLVQDPERNRSVAVYRPVYRGGVIPATPAERRRNLQGFLVILLCAADLSAVSRHQAQPAGIDWMLIDESAPPENRLLHFQPSRLRATPVPPPPGGRFTGPLVAGIALQVPGRAWSMQFAPAPEFHDLDHRSREWLMLAFGLALTTLLAVYQGSRIRRAVEVENLARRDYLTGLPNRALLAERLEHALTLADREARTLAVLFLDLDRFKHINDSMGHSVGDHLLKQVAQRLSTVVRREDTLVRMGGDEFVVLMEHFHHERDAALLADKVIQSLADPIEVNGLPVYLTTSIGISLYPRDARSAEGLISNADAAMYRAKESGRNAYQFYTPELTRIAHEQVTLVSDLKHALERQELELHYQPQVGIADGRIFGVEALLRWRHGDAGLVTPDRFIPLAEDTGLIIPIGEWVLREACSQAQHWLEAGLPLERISVNLAGPQIQRGNIVSAVERILADTGLPPGKLELEVTESFVMGQEDAAIATLRRLRRLGITIAVDDFGTGYSSLSRLKRLPIDRLKIDRSFVQDLPHDEDDTAIARAVIALGHSLGLRVIAEGVETAAQAQFLLDEGCQEAQGYYYSRPVAADAVAGLMRGNGLARSAPGL